MAKVRKKIRSAIQGHHGPLVYGYAAAILDAILDFSVNQSRDINFDSTMAFYDPNNIGVDTKTMALQ